MRNAKLSARAAGLTASRRGDSRRRDGAAGATSPLAAQPGGRVLILVNLESAEERRRVMLRQLATIGVEPLRVGIDLRDATHAGVRRWFDTRFQHLGFDHGVLSNAEIGCWASHLTAWWTLLHTDGARACTVLEDDLLLKPGFGAAIAGLEMQDAFDVVYLGTSSKNISERRRTSIGRLHVHQPVGVIFNTWGYVITRRYAERFFASDGMRIDMPIDHFLGGRARWLKPSIAVLRPAVVTEHPTLGAHSQISPYTAAIDRIDRWPAYQKARRALLSSKVSDLYYSLYRLL